ncbi:hypothetical protein HAD_05350 [Hyphomonas adhaerens MHS-3]|uniref:Uncharacterized protein n=1 Tax=Hyphomonas adhaerens MHS-3 TaxID=1280949 RepID=A0A069E913_9PROT|nr:hypothetical protein [Hyphomonas adhaerens]KCZ85081.1 hypothetical protein HAD_05350 [Hyphomonas adhaerens MHS-3]
MVEVIKLDQWIAEAAEKFESLEMHIDDTNGLFSDVPESWNSLDDIPDEHIAAWARILIRELSDLGLQLGTSNHADTRRQRFREIEGVLSIVQMRLFWGEFLIHQRNEIYEGYKQIQSMISHARSRIAQAAMVGASPELGIHPSHSQHKSVSVSFRDLQRCAIGSVRLLQGSGLSRRKASENVSNLLAKYGEYVAPDTLRKDWYEIVGDEDREAETYRSYEDILLSWFGDDVVPSWRKEIDSSSTQNKVAPSFLAWALSRKNDLLIRFIPKVLKAAVEEWFSEQELWGKRGV